jgi:hypothetical protein
MKRGGRPVWRLGTGLTTPRRNEKKKTSMSDTRPRTGCCEQGTETCCTNGDKFLDYLRDHWLLKNSALRTSVMNDILLHIQYV